MPEQASSGGPFLLPPAGTMTAMELLTAQRSKTEESSAPTTPRPPTAQDARMGQVLEERFVALEFRKEREWVLPIFSKEYGIDFRDAPVDPGSSISFTSKKGILEDAAGTRYFIKEKPFYCKTPEALERAGTVQNFLAERLPFVPRIISTTTGELFVKLNQRVLFVTKLVAGENFSGSMKHSCDAMTALATLHTTSAQFTALQCEPVDSVREAHKFVDWMKNLPFPDRALHSEVESLMRKTIDGIPSPGSTDRIWIHGDYAPFNLVYGPEGVRAVNDFDNVAIGESARDIGTALLTHTAIYYLANTSSFNRPILRSIDDERMEKMIEAYISVRDLSAETLRTLPAHVTLHWIELLGLGLMRGDYSLLDVRDVLDHHHELFQRTASVVERIIDKNGDRFDMLSGPTMNNSAHALPAQHETRQQYETRWRALLSTALPGCEQQLERFFADDDKGFEHSYQVFARAYELAQRVERADNTSVSFDVIDQLSVFHDIGKFFQDVTSWENLSIAQTVYDRYVKAMGINATVAARVREGIPATDFYCARLEPKGVPPASVEAEIVRASDKMQDNMVRKVDRYWFEYGVPRGATFFDPALTMADREKFWFGNFVGDQLNVILTIIALRPSDLGHRVLQEEYAQWSREPKQAVIRRVLALAREIGESDERMAQIEAVVNEYRQRYGC